MEMIVCPISPACFGRKRYETLRETIQEKRRARLRGRCGDEEVCEGGRAANVFETFHWISLSAMLVSQELDPSVLPLTDSWPVVEATPWSGRG